MRKIKKGHLHSIGGGLGGRSKKWTISQTKTIRVPVYLAERLLDLARYMDQHDGELPDEILPVITVSHPPSTGEALCCDLQTRDLQWI